MPSGRPRRSSASHVLAPHDDGLYRVPARLGLGHLHALVVGPGPGIGRHHVADPRAGTHAEVLRRLVAEDDLVGIGIDDDQGHLHGVQEVLFFLELPLGSELLPFRPAAVAFEAGEEGDQEDRREEEGQEVEMGLGPGEEDD